MPASDFFRGILSWFRLEHIHLNPNSILHLAIFVHLCEAFFGISPYFQLFWNFFRFKSQPSKDEIASIGGSGLLLRKNQEKMYLKYKLINSNSG